MTADRRFGLFLAGVLAIAIYATVFPLLTVDTLMRIAGRAETFEGRNLLMLLFLEGSRLLASVIGIAIALLLVVRAAREPAGRSLSLFLLFAIITLEKVFGSNGYPGPAQESVTMSLIAAGVSTDFLAWLFGDNPWPVWFAAIALLRFSVTFPRMLQPEVLEASGRQDRRGWLRSSGIAGLDIGLIFRRVSNALLERGRYRPAALLAVASVLVLMQTFLRGPAVTAAGWLFAATALCLAVTNIRAAYLSARDADRVRVMWVIEAFSVALAMFVVSTAALITVPSAVAKTAAFVLIMLIPPAVTACLALSVLDRGELNAQDAIDLTGRYASICVTLTVTFGLLYMILGFTAEVLGMSRALGALVAVIGVALGFEILKKTSDSIRRRILERPGRTE